MTNDFINDALLVIITAVSIIWLVALIYETFFSKEE